MKNSIDFVLFLFSYLEYLFNVLYLYFYFFGKTPSLSPFGLQKIIENIKQKCVEDIKTEN